MSAIIRNHHVLAVPDKNASAAFFVETMGFTEVHRDDGWVFVSKDSCMIMLGECVGAIPPGDLGDHNYFSYLLVDDVDQYHRQLVERNVSIINPLADKSWGMREFGIRTPDGYRIMIGQVIET